MSRFRKDITTAAIVSKVLIALIAILAFENDVASAQTGRSPSDTGCKVDVSGYVHAPQTAAILFNLAVAMRTAADSAWGLYLVGTNGTVERTSSFLWRDALEVGLLATKRDTSNQKLWMTLAEMQMDISFDTFDTPGVRLAWRYATCAVHFAKLVNDTRTEHAATELMTFLDEEIRRRQE